VRATPVLLGLFGVFTLTWSSAPTPEDYVRQGNAAFDRADYQAAVDLYSKAEDRTTDPGMVAFNKAAALYRLAAQPDNDSRRAALNREAEQSYRRCLEDADGPRQAQALYGLGNSLLQQGDRGADVLREAVRCYERVLAHPDVAAVPDLADDARFNLELAKLLLLQAPAGNPNKPNDPNSDENKDKDPPRPPDQPRGQADQGTNTGQKPVGVGDRVKPEPGTTPIKTDEMAPGEGKLPPVPDKDEPVALSPEDAREHLLRATERVLRERREYQRRSVKPPARDVKDW
jgi:tetratricopeptide (TPR) repeat protein